MPTMGADTKCATYQAAGRLSGITNSGDGNLPDFSYDGYDLVGNLSDFTAGGDNYEYTYDEMNRLDTVSGAITRNYDYDRLGNIDQAIVNGVTRNYTYASGNPMRLMGVTDLPLTVDSTAGYDTWGNMRKYALGGVAYELTFNAENRLASVKVGAATPTTFSYDADGQRVQTNYPDGTIVYTPFPDYEVTDPPTGANTVRTTYRLAGQIVAVQTKVGAAAGTFYYTYTDHLGNVTALSTTAGAFVAGSEARYDPFGAFTTPPTASNPSISNHGYTGHRHNNTGANDLGLIYMNARYYLPEVGRFISADTIVPDPGNPQSYNRYSYSFNNPVNYTDSSGHCIDGVSTWVCIAAGAAFIAKVVDYGLTAWDAYQASRTLANPNASQADKMMAALTVGLSIAFEAIEPDDLLPIGVPADDVARRAIMNGAQEAYERGGPEALEGLLRDQLGDHADGAIKKMDDLLGLDPDSLYAAAVAPSGKGGLSNTGRTLQKHANRPGDIWAQYLPDGALNPANYNARASELVMNVLTDPGTSRRYWTNDYGQRFIDYYAPDGRGLRYWLDGSFAGFINP